MAISQVEIEKRLDALKKARDAGVLRVKSGDTETWFRTLDEMNQIISALEGQLTGAVKRKRFFYPRQDSKGF